jgi:hypothetical protein
MAAKKKPAAPVADDKVHPNSKLTRKTVQAIRDDYARGVSIAEIASSHGLGIAVARDIATGRLFA